MLQLQHREDLGAGWGAERAGQMRSDRAVWLLPGWKGGYRVAAGGRRWWVWHMTWRADQGEGVPVRKVWGGGAARGRKGRKRVHAHFTRATLAPAPATQGHRGQEVVFAFREEITLKAAEAIRMALDDRAAHMANRTYHVHPQTGDEWHYAFPGEEGMESISPLPECERQGNEASALANVAEEWLRQARGAEQVTGTNWTVGAIRRARYRRAEWMTREDINFVFSMATKVPAAAQWTGQAVLMLLPDDRLGDRGTMEVEVRHGQEGKVPVQCTGA